ncbi:MAG: hypothetical protein M0015_16650 [Betaproteobacteria bacterium]|nr:hypothetical protein [Betaproteobacteria bacterium]
MSKRVTNRELNELLAQAVQVGRARKRLKRRVHEANESGASVRILERREQNHTTQQEQRSADAAPLQRAFVPPVVAGSLTPEELHIVRLLRTLPPRLRSQLVGLIATAVDDAAARGEIGPRPERRLRLVTTGEQDEPPLQ